MKRCPACGAQAPMDAEHCAHCPASFPSEPTPVAAPTRTKRRTISWHAWRHWIYAGIGFAVVLAFAGFLGKRTSPLAVASSARFDPMADADRDLQEGITRAKVTRRRVLIEVGGNWCLWCLRMEDFFNANSDLADLRDREFVSVYVSVTPERPNTLALSRFPAVPSYPHLFVLDENGKLLASQDTSELESGTSYDRYRVETFLHSQQTPPATSGIGL